MFYKSFESGRYLTRCIITASNGNDMQVQSVLNANGDILIAHHVLYDGELIDRDFTEQELQQVKSQFDHFVVKA